jgi:tetratricopeptide (TPR) repeat protein
MLRALPDLYVAMADEATRALELLDRAIALEPDYALAHAYAAWCHEIRFVRDRQSPTERDAAISHAHAAIAHGPDDAIALSLAAFVLAMVASDMATAGKAFEQALAISPSCFFALCFGSAAFGWKGEAERAIDWGERGRRLSPFDRLLYGPGHGLALGHFMLGHSEKAVDAARFAVQAKPEFSLSHILMAAALAQAGRLDEAKAAGTRALALQPGFSTRGLCAAVGIPPALAEPLSAALREAGVPE